MAHSHRNGSHIIARLGTGTPPEGIDMTAFHELIDKFDDLFHGQRCDDVLLVNLFFMAEMAHDIGISRKDFVRMAGDGWDQRLKERKAEAANEPTPR